MTWLSWGAGGSVLCIIIDCIMSNPYISPVDSKCIRHTRTVFNRNWLHLLFRLAVTKYVIFSVQCYIKACQFLAANGASVSLLHTHIRIDCKRLHPLVRPAIPTTVTFRLQLISMLVSSLQFSTIDANDVSVSSKQYVRLIDWIWRDTANLITSNSIKVTEWNNVCQFPASLF